MKTQTLYKRLSMPLLVTVISATGIGVSSPARSASLLGSQSTIIDTNPEATLIAGRVPPCKRGQMPPGCDPGHTQARPEPDSTSDEKLEIENRVRQQQQQRELEQQRRELEQQRRELEQQRRELEQQPTQ